MTEREKQAPVATQELLVTTLATSEARAKLPIEKGLITQEEFLRKISHEKSGVSRSHEKQFPIITKTK